MVSLYGLGVGIITVSQISSKFWRGHSRAGLIGTPQSMLLNVFYDKKHEYIWFRGRVWTVSEILNLKRIKRSGACPGTPQGTSRSVF